MQYDGLDITELADLAFLAEEPIVVSQGFLVAEDMASIHNWILQSPWYDTQIVQWSPDAVSTRTIRSQRIAPPEGWVPGVVPEPPVEETPAETTPVIQLQVSPEN